MPKKPKTQARLKKDLDAVFSKYIRYKYADENGIVCCYTCTTCKPVKEMQNGHWIPRNNLATRFSEDNCRPQCLTKESKLRLSDGSERSIADIQIGDCLHGFDEETFANKESVVLQKQSFLPEKLYKVELENGQSFFATGDHKIVANGKWYSVASMLHDCNAYDILEK